MPQLKITSWNVEHMDRLFDPPGSETTAQRNRRRLDALVREIREIDPDVLCVLEGPKGEGRIDQFCQAELGGDYAAVKAADGDYGIQGDQWIWFLVKQALAPAASLLPTSTWDEFAGSSWAVHYWGSFEESRYRHYRHPQTLVLEVAGTRIEAIGLHLKSKFVRSGKSDWNAGGERRQRFIQEAIKARIKLTTQATNVRAYIDRKFEQTPDPGIFVLGDLNDGPGKEFFEERYLFFDLLSNIQGDVFFAQRFLNHALFDFDDHLRWSVTFDDFIDPERDPHILLDHILFTQPLVDGSLPVQLNEHAGLVEHEIHELINAGQPGYAHTSDHHPVSVVADVAA